MSDPIREALEAAKDALAVEYNRTVNGLLTAAIALLDKPHPDTERLDWLEAQKYGAWGIGPNLMQNGWDKQVETGGESFHGRTFRATIDQARGAK